MRDASDAPGGWSDWIACGRDTSDWGIAQMGTHGSGREGGRGAECVEEAIGELRDAYGDAYPDELFDRTRSYLDGWLVSGGGRGGVRTEDVTSIDDDETGPVAFAAAQSFMLGYATGLDGDYIMDGVTVEDIVSDLDVGDDVITGMAHAFADVYPRHIIVRASAYCATVVSVGLGSYVTDGGDEDDEDGDGEESLSKGELARIVRACFKAFCHGCDCGERAVYEGHLPDVPQNHAIRDALVAAGCVSAVGAAFGGEDGDQEVDQVGIASVECEDGRRVAFPVPPSLMASGEFSYDADDGTITYRFHADDLPDFMNGVNVPALIARQVMMYALHEQGIAVPSSDGALDMVRALIDGSDDDDDGDDDGSSLSPAELYGMCRDVIPTLGSFVEGTLVRHSGVYDDEYFDEAVPTACAFAEACFDGMRDATNGDVNMLDDTLPPDDDGAFDDAALASARDMIGGWCARNGMADWAYVASVVRAANAVDDYDIDIDGDGDDGQGPDAAHVADVSARILAAVGIGYASGIAASDTMAAARVHEGATDTSWV